MAVVESLPVVLAHPIVEPGGLPVPPAVIATLAVFALISGLRWSPQPDEAPREELLQRRSGNRLSGGLGVAALVAIIGASLAGEFSILPALSLTLVWPVAILVSAFIGPLWPAVDPFSRVGSAAARVRTGLRQGTHPSKPTHLRGMGVHAAAIPAFVLAAHVALSPRVFDPTVIGLGVSAYTVVVIIGSFTFGHTAWLGKADILSIHLGWIARIPRSGLLNWVPPRGVPGVIGILIGGLLFAAVRRSTVWSSFPVFTTRIALLTGFALFVIGTVTVIVAAERYSARRHAEEGTVVAAMVPLLAASALTIALIDNLLFVSLRLVPRALTDPLGRGWDLLRVGGVELPAPVLGTSGLAILHTLILLAGAFVGVRVALGRSGGRRHAAAPAVYAVALFLAVATVAVSAV